MLIDIDSLSNAEIKEELNKYGFSTGPITASTKPLYLSKLKKCINDKPLHSKNNIKSIHKVKPNKRDVSA